MPKIHFTLVNVGQHGPRIVALRAKHKKLFFGGGKKDGAMALSEFEMKRYEILVKKFIEGKRPEKYLRDKLDFGYRFKGQSVELFTIRPRWNDPKEILESNFAKATYVQAENIWKVYWLRADLKWHRYGPNPSAKTIEEFLSVVGNDEHCCFFG